MNTANVRPVDRKGGGTTISSMSSWRKGLAVQLIVVAVATMALVPARIGSASPANTLEPPAACSINAFGHSIVRPANTPLGILMPITISVENISRKTCTIGCRDNPVGVRVLDSRKRLVTDLGVLAAAGSPPDQSSLDGVIHWPIKPGQTYDQSRTWNQGICASSTCRPVAPGGYIIEVGWTRPDGSVTRTAKVSIKRQPECPKSVGTGQLAPWCAGTAPKNPFIPTTTQPLVAATG